MNLKSAVFWLSFIALLLTNISCIKDLGVTFPSVNLKKRKKKIAPSYDFNNALFDYRKKNGYWPKSELDLSAYNGKVVRDLTFHGFESWSLGEFSNDTLLVYWIHEPIADGTHIGVVPIPDKKIYLITQYTFSNRTAATHLIKRRKFLREIGI